jgi:hypothetical protein
MQPGGLGGKTLAISGAVLLAALDIAFFLGSTPRARLNVIQIGAVIVLLVILFRIRPIPPCMGNPQPPQFPLPARWARLWILLPLGMALIAYMGELSVFFLSDDFAHIAHMQHPTPLEVFRRHLVEGQASTFLRPLGFLSLALDIHLWGLWPPGYHLTSLFWHVISVAGVYSLAKVMGARPLFCTLASSFFALLPVNVETVVWPAARFDLLATAATL